MKTLAAIDPGAKRCALALFHTGQLATIAEQESFVHPDISFDRAVYEVPQADGRGAPVDDLLAVATAGAQLAAWCSLDVQRYQPREWKGSVPKAVHHAHAWPRFTLAERALLGGDATEQAIAKACERGAKARWQKRGALAGNHFYSDRELPTVGGLKITHDLLDAAVLGLHDLGRLADANGRRKGTL